jgi:ATP-dependent Clp protease ATP-binding subunit ClpC
MDEAGSRAGANECDQAVRLTTQQLQATTRKRDEALATLAYDTLATIRLQEIALKARLEEQLSDRIRTLERQPYIVKTSDVERAVATMTGIPVERLSHCETERLRTLADHLHRRVVGQTAAVNSLSRALLRSRAGLKDTNCPIGVFLFVGPTGVGKTLLAKELSRWLFDERRGLIRLDMSEYGERHNVARLIGSPPGYVGYGEGGQLTEAVRRQPYAVVLLDEIEKAHPDVFNIMLQIFDEGHLTDGAGRRVDFRNTVIILTSNVGSRTAAHSSSLGYQTLSNERSVEKSGTEIYRKALENHFAPEFLGRIDDIVCFNHLSTEDVEQIVALELSEIFSRARILGYNVDITPEARRELATTGYNPDYGVRSLRRTLTKMVEEPLSMLIVDGQLRDGHNVIVEHSPHSGLTLRVA